MDALLTPETLRYIASEGAAPQPVGVRLYVKRKGEKVFVTLNGISMMVHDNGSWHCLPLKFTEVDVGAFNGTWSTGYTFDVQFVTQTLNAQVSVPVGLAVDVFVIDGFENEIVAIPQLQCSGVFISQNCVRLLFPANGSVKAMIRSQQFAVHSSHQSVAEMRTELLPRVPFCANKCKLHIVPNIEQHRSVCQTFSVLMGDSGSWRQCFNALCTNNQPKSTDPQPQQLEEACLVSL